MASLNEFKILNAKCRKYFDLLEIDMSKKYQTLEEKKKERYGFYLFIIESICGIKDISDITPLITDYDFNLNIFNEGFEDCGVDAVYINDEEYSINLFNFKFREKFNADREQSINESYLTTKFINAITNESDDGINGKLKVFLNLIIDKLIGSEIWKLKYYIVSNESKELSPTTPELKTLTDLYDLEIIPIGLDTISSLMSLRPEPINAIIHVDKDSLLPFVESNLSSAKSYVIRIGANDLIRITCNNSVYRDDYAMEDFSVLHTAEMDYNLLFDNVRGFVSKSKFNDNISHTLKLEPTKFFMYNNGLTLTANDIIAEPTNGNKKLKITIKDFQIVNGGQTLRSIHNFKQQDADNIEKYLSNCEILIRVFKTVSGNNTRNKIAEFTNSQNAISSIDLKSLSSEQIQIEQFLDDNNIIYARKSGDTGISATKVYEYKISMEKFGQIMFALQGNPEKASNLKKHIFEKYYNSVFKEPNFDITKSAEIVRRYFAIKEQYEKNGIIESSDQRIFYVLYIDRMIDCGIKEKIEIVESTLSTYQPADKTLPDVRKLLQVTFRDKLVEIVEEKKKRLTTAST